VRVIARRPDTIVDFGGTRSYTETAAFKVRASDVVNPRSDDRLLWTASDARIRVSA
jgi:hypothetical protein